MHSQPLINIVLVHQRLKLHWKDLADISHLIIEKSRHIRVLLVSEVDTADVLPPDVWQWPTMTVSFGPVGRFNPPRGPIFANKAISKVDQAARLAGAGVATPRTKIFRLGEPLDPKEWGEFVILKPKPLRLTSRSDGIYLYRTERLNRLKEQDFPAAHMIRRMPMLVQQFVDTGPRASKQRITTLFGEPFHWAYSANKSPRPPLASADEILDSAIISSAASEDRDWSCAAPSHEMLDTARRAGAVFPNMPLLGLDLLRCNATGRVYVLEINAGGNVWHYSSPYAAADRAANPETYPTEVEKRWSFNKAAEILLHKALVAAK
jgi:hypothetical protein